MQKYKIHYKITPYSIREKILEVKLSFLNCHDRTLKLYKGKILFLEFNCNAHYTEDNYYYYIEINNSLEISYRVYIGTPGKHGFYGEISNDLLAFAGEQILLLPFDVLTCDSIKSSHVVDDIVIDYDFPCSPTNIVPFKHIDSGKTTSICSAPKWGHIYELMKSSYVFGNFSTYEFTHLNSILSVYVDTDLTNIKNDTINEISKLFTYYNALFNNTNHKLSIVLLRGTNGDEILGGCGRSIIASSFNKDSSRDWQLLSHRMLHSFMDTAFPLSDFHTPPTLWLTEGLATYYENMALESLSNDLKEHLSINVETEFKTLFNRYLYTTLKDSYNFSFPPMEEVNISSAGRIEFLHYTQAPLIIKLVEDICSKSGKKDTFINELFKLDMSNGFSLQSLFTNVLGSNLDIFAMKYLFNNEILPMWYLKDICSDNEKEIIDDLNYFEYVLYTWMALEDSSYIQDTISSQNILLYSDLAEKNKIYFTSPTVETQIKDYSPTIYALLKQYALRARLCKVNYYDANLRYNLLGNENNINIWEDFISNYNKN